MSDQTTSESSDYKSHVKIDRNASERKAAFDVGDEVKMRVTETGIDGKRPTHFKEFAIADRRYQSGSWQYQLTDPVKSSLWEGGKWFPESNLSSA